MERFFSGDNPVIGFLNDVVDLIILELVWFVLCIPVFTVGASTSAFYYAVNKVIRKKKGQVLPEFWRAFKEGFKNSSVIWLIVAAIELVCGYGMLCTLPALSSGTPVGFSSLLFLLVAVFTFFYFMTACAVTARFSNKALSTVRNALVIMFANPQIMIFQLLMSVVMGIIFTFLTVSAVFIPMTYIVVLTFILEPVFFRYMTPEEQLAEKEDERYADN
ncbi:MAG: YesL family protein [Lachnospiraceae bacterium]|nr:YesL family protein [Lachnospiraceae bacterium]